MRNNKEKRNLIFLLVILICLVCIVDRAISRKIISPTPEIEQGWDKTLKIKLANILTEIRQFRIPRISITVRPLSWIYFSAFNRGIPPWFAAVIAYVPVPSIIGIGSFFFGKRKWNRIRERKIARILALGIFFLFTTVIIYKALRRQFDEIFFIFTIAIFIPATLGGLLTEKSANRRFKVN